MPAAAAVICLNCYYQMHGANRNSCQGALAHDLTAAAAGDVDDEDDCYDDYLIGAPLILIARWPGGDYYCC